MWHTTSWERETGEEELVVSEALTSIAADSELSEDDEAAVLR